jgi:hypothetical protein
VRSRMVSFFPSALGVVEPKPAASSTMIPRGVPQRFDYGHVVRKFGTPKSLEATSSPSSLFSPSSV